MSDLIEKYEEIYSSDSPYTPFATKVGNLFNKLWGAEDYVQEWLIYSTAFRTGYSIIKAEDLIIKKRRKINLAKINNIEPPSDNYLLRYKGNKSDKSYKFLAWVLEHPQIRIQDLFKDIGTEIIFQKEVNKLRNDIPSMMKHFYDNSLRKNDQGEFYFLWKEPMIFPHMFYKKDKPNFVEEMIEENLEYFTSKIYYPYKLGFFTYAFEDKIKL